MRHGYSRIVRDHVVMYRLDRFRVRLHPADLKHQSPEIGVLIGQTENRKRERRDVGTGNHDDAVADFSEDTAISSQTTDCRIQTDAKARVLYIRLYREVYTHVRNTHVHIDRSTHARFPLAKLPQRGICIFLRIFRISDARNSSDFTRASRRTQAHARASTVTYHLYMPPIPGLVIENRIPDRARRDSVIIPACTRARVRMSFRVPPTRKASTSSCVRSKRD